jgi:hypothetical protein
MIDELDIIDFDTGVDIMELGHPDDLLDLDVVEGAVGRGSDQDHRGVISSNVFGAYQQNHQHDIYKEVLDTVPFQLMDTESKRRNSFDAALEFRIDLPELLEGKTKRQYKKRGPKSPRSPKTPKAEPKAKLGRKRKSDELHLVTAKQKKLLKSYMSDSTIAVTPKQRCLKKSQSEMGHITSAPTKSNPLASKKPLSPKALGFDDSKGGRQTSTFRGVSCCGKDRKWQARIRDANRVRYLGRYHTEVEAALEYDKVAREIKGGKAPTNFVDMSPELIEAVKHSFAEHGYIVEKYQHLVVRSKAKSPPSSPKSVEKDVLRPFSGDDSDFPESPLAKVHSITAPSLNLTKLPAKPVSSLSHAVMSTKFTPMAPSSSKGRALNLE